MSDGRRRRAWVQAGGRFHFEQLVVELRRLGRFDGGVTARRFRVTGEGVRTMRALAWARAIHRFSPAERVWSSSLTWDAAFDRLARRQFERRLGTGRDADRLALHGFAAYSRCTARLARRLGVPVVIDTGSLHIVEQRRLVQLAYESAGLRCRPFPDAWVDAQVEEYELADRVLVGSPLAAASFANGVQSKVRIAPYGIDTGRFTPRAEYGSDGSLIVGFIGNVNPEKGIHLLCQAVEAVGGDVELHVVGHVAPELRRWWRGAGAVAASHVEELTGRDLVAFMQRIDVLAVPSCQDGYPLVAAEALAAGTPCVISANAGMAHYIEEGGAGVVVGAFDAAALADALIRLAGDRPQLERMGRAGVVVAASLSAERYAIGLEAAYADLDG